MAMDIEAKRLDSLARNRALAMLKERHSEEWEELRRVIHANLKAEQLLLGDVERDRNTSLHQDDGNGICEHCGDPTPCRQMKKRERQREARRRVAVPTPEDRS